MTLAIIGLVLFVWFELSDDIQNHANSISEIRVEIADMRAELVEKIVVGNAEIVALIADLKAELTRETHTNRERIYRLESRVPNDAP